MAKNRTQDAAELIGLLQLVSKGAGNALAEQDYVMTLEWLSQSAGYLERATAATVAAWRAYGASWAEVGNALGMSKQAAWQRFGASSAK